MEQVVCQTLVSRLLRMDRLWLTLLGIHLTTVDLLLVCCCFRTFSYRDVFPLKMVYGVYPFVGTHCRATKSHLPYGITQCYLPSDKSECAPP